MYDMYHWNRIEGADDAARGATGTASRPTTSRPAAASHNAAPSHNGAAAHKGTTSHNGAAVQALQVALDRRDNGGDLGATRDE